MQTKLAEFLLVQSTLGKEIIVETHSEHVLNALRLYVAFGKIQPETLGVYFCDKDAEGTTLVAVEMDEDGYIQNWPDGFFDESEKVLLELAKLNTS
jgi:predicted ATPase|tara:strand:- start:129 stop:416 length:288 start_codon:yes stop_codon:yes gene_type:complete